MEPKPNAPAAARDEIIVDAEPQRVWDVLTDIDRWPEWQPGVSRARLEGSLGPGSTFRWRANGLPIRSTLREVEPPSRVSWEGKAPGTRAAHVWTLAAQGSQTVVRTEESFEGWLPRLMRKSMQRNLEGALRGGLEGLKRRAEERRN